MNKQLQTFDSKLTVSSLNAFIAWIHQIPLLSAEEEHLLATRFYKDGDIEAARKLILAHLRFVVRIARNYSGYGLSQADLIQEGNIGLMKAVKRFNPTLGVRLVSFAIHWIKAEIHEFILRNWRIVKIATTKAQRKLFFNLRKLTKHIGWLSNQEVTDLASDLKVPEYEVRNIEMRLHNADEVLDPLVSENSEQRRPLLDLLEDDRFTPDLVEKQEFAKKREEVLNHALLGLDQRSLDIIRQRWFSDEKTTLQELAIQYGISIERVRQLEKQAMNKLKKIIEKYNLT